MIVALTLAGWLDLVGTVVLAGGALFAAFVHVAAPSGRRVARAAIGAVSIALLVELILTALRLEPFDSAQGWGFLWDVLTTRWALFWMARGAGLCVLAACRLGSPSQVALIVPWLLLRSFQGHAGAHGTVPALIDGLHLFAACAWLGGLVQFSLLSAGELLAALPRFRRLATLALAAVLPSGVYAALLHVPSIDALVDSAYGRVLLIKLVAVTLLIAVAASSHLHHRRPRPTTVPSSRWKRVHVEIAIGSAILLLSALLGSLPMPHPPPG